MQSINRKGENYSILLLRKTKFFFNYLTPPNPTTEKWGLEKWEGIISNVKSQSVLKLVDIFNYLDTPSILSYFKMPTIYPA